MLFRSKTKKHNLQNKKKIENSENIIDRDCILDSSVYTVLNQKKVSILIQDIYLNYKNVNIIKYK